MKTEIPKEHQLKCEGCGKILDMRDTSILSHGWIEEGKIVCYDEEPIPYSSSKKVGDSVQWTSDKKAIRLSIMINASAINILGKAKGDEDFIFHLPSHTACLKDLKVWVKKAEIKKKITWHCARHSFATNIIFYGSDVNSASSLLGHSSLNYTQRYVHVVNSLKEKAVENLPALTL